MDIGDVVEQTPPPANGGNGGNGGNPPPTQKTPQQLLDDAEGLFAEVDKALENHDLATYQLKVNEARALVQQALANLGQS